MSERVGEGMSVVWAAYFAGSLTGPVWVASANVSRGAEWLTRGRPGRTAKGSLSEASGHEYATDDARGATP